MAKDVTEKPVSSSNSDNNSPPTSDQQRVPPLRIVLNVSGNQKSSSSSGAGSTNQHELKREKSNDTRTEASASKPGGKVRIKLGTGKPANRNNNNNSAESQDRSSDESHKTRLTRDHDNSSTKDDASINYSHLRRITRRSQRTVQTVSNEDEESISSMTSTDENQNSNNNSSATVNNSDSNGASQDCAPVASTPTSAATTSSTVGAPTSADTPRRKRRKGESITETPLIDYESNFNFQNYRVSVQNSFELFKNIRKHVDQKLKALSSVHPRAPHGFRDYILTRGAYLLDGNKLGNGTNLFMNEDGGMNPAPIGKYHLLRHNSVNYTVPNRAKVPLGLPVNSPLYNLFNDQEKERYRMQIQHIKEREKLTLAVEQEIMRVYNQAAMAAVNQVEPFSACTMLKHQEIYNYLDSEGEAILASEDARLDQVKPSDGVRTRRRQHEQITSPSRKTSSTNETSTPQNAAQKMTSDQPAAVEDESKKEESESIQAATKDEMRNDPAENLQGENDRNLSKERDGNQKTTENSPATHSDDTRISPRCPDKSSTKSSDESVTVKSGEKNNTQVGDGKNDELKLGESTSEVSGDSGTAGKSSTESIKVAYDSDTKSHKNGDYLRNSGDHNDKAHDPVELGHEIKHRTPSGDSQSSNDPYEKGNTVIAMEMNDESRANCQTQEEEVLTEDDVKAYNRQIFLSQLQGIDDKWERIRAEMLVRHRNEAESLYAVQKLEWEWKTKEIGACDVRMVPIIDETLVPKLSIYAQDY